MVFVKARCWFGDINSCRSLCYQLYWYISIHWIQSITFCCTQCVAQFLYLHYRISFKPFQVLTDINMTTHVRHYEVLIRLEHTKCFYSLLSTWLPTYAKVLPPSCIVISYPPVSWCCVGLLFLLPRWLGS